MINRILIRVKVIQMVYSYLLTKNERSLAEAQNELSRSLDKSYELYNALLILLVELTDVQALNLDEAKNKFYPTEEDLNPNTRFVDNHLVEILRNNQTLLDYQEDNKVTWKNDIIFLRLLLDKITHSKVYQDYMSSETSGLKEDCKFWIDVIKDVLIDDEDFLELLESKSVYWNDDLDTMATFVVKTIKRIEKGELDGILPMYKDKEDSLFGSQLFNLSIQLEKENNELIDKFIRDDRWDADRLAFMDRVIMNVAITEIKKFDKIPTLVSLNEYIEIAKFYSTPKSGQFVNGVLNSVVKYLKSEKMINKI